MSGPSLSKTDSTEQMSITHDVVTEVAATVGQPPDELEPPLFEVLDPEALEQLFHQGDTETIGHVEFRYAGCNVTVTSDGAVTATSVEGETTTSPDSLAVDIHGESVSSTIGNSEN